MVNFFFFLNIYESDLRKRSYGTLPVIGTDAGGPVTLYVQPSVNTVGVGEPSKYPQRDSNSFFCHIRFCIQIYIYT